MYKNNSFYSILNGCGTMFDNVFTLLESDIPNRMESISPFYPYRLYEFPSDKEKEIAKNLVESNYPYNNYVDKENCYNVSVALSGYDDDKVEIVKERNFITVTLKAIENEPPKDVVLFHKGLKTPNKEETIKMFIDSERFDMDKVEASLKNGMLHIKVSPLEKAKPVSIKIKK